MLSEKEFNKYNFFEQIGQFEKYAKGLKDMLQYLEEAIKFFNLLKKHDLKKYKINSSKSYIFIDNKKKDFGLKIIHLERPDREILFNFDDNETPLIFNDTNNLCYDSMFGQGVEATGVYLLKMLELYFT